MIDTRHLSDWGWTEDRDDEFREQASGDQAPARVFAQHRGEYRLIVPWGEATGVAPGRMLYEASGQRELPAVGDWVVIEPVLDGPATVVGILPRRTCFVRRRAGQESGEQVIAANVDVAFIVTSLNEELSPRRIERYLVAVRESGATPVVVLTKSDLCSDVDAAVEGIRESISGAPIEVVSSVSGEGLEALRERLEPGRTVVLVGSSGVGKSTLINAFAGFDLLATQDIRSADGKGRHTTTHREIFRLPDGLLLLDTPGVREFGLLEAEEGIQETFEDVGAVAGSCRFRDCTHTGEPGCAVREAIEAGTLSAERWASYDRLQKETRYEVRRRDAGAAHAERKKWKQIHKDFRKRPKKGSAG